jgi:hypothetical protein
MLSSNKIAGTDSNALETSIGSATRALLDCQQADGH